MLLFTLGLLGAEPLFPKPFEFPVPPPTPGTGPASQLPPFPEFNPVAVWEPPGREPRKVKTQNDGVWGSLSSQVTVQDFTSPAWDDPLRQREWHREDAWKYNVTGPLFCFGRLGADSQEAGARDMKVVGRTGVGCKLGLGGDGEVQLRGGPGVTCTDPLRAEKTHEQAQWLVEVEARYPLLAGVGLEYSGTACPALNPAERDWVNQDVRLAFPVGGNGKFRVGARHHWENYAEPRPLSDGMQLYLGLELFR
jgi:hypothetical protein